MLRFDSTPTIIHNRTHESWPQFYQLLPLPLPWYKMKPQTVVLATTLSQQGLYLISPTMNLLQITRTPVMVSPSQKRTMYTCCHKMITLHSSSSRRRWCCGRAWSFAIASLVVTPLPHNQDLSHDTPAVQDQDTAQECQSLLQFQSPILYSTAPLIPSKWILVYSGDSKKKSMHGSDSPIKLNCYKSGDSDTMYIQTVSLTMWM